jgi:histidinol phosphatase-like PHP family hydrolase
MTPQDTFQATVNYVKKAKEMQEIYKNVMTILVGLESEWIQKENQKQELNELLERVGGVQYIIGSVHHVIFFYKKLKKYIVLF